jgi:hypothetical protein
MLCTDPDEANCGTVAGRRLLPARSNAALIDAASGCEHATAGIGEPVPRKNHAGTVKALSRTL